MVLTFNLYIVKCDFRWSVKNKKLKSFSKSKKSPEGIKIIKYNVF